MIYLTIIVRFDFTCSKTISPLFYEALKAEWLLIVLSKPDIKQIIIMCCNVVKRLKICDTDNIYKQNVNIVLCREREFNDKKNYTGLCIW